MSSQCACYQETTTTTTSTTTTTTTTVPEATTTTTTAAPATTTTSLTPVVTVQGETLAKAAPVTIAAVQAPAAALAVTGANDALLIVVGTATIGVGVLLRRLARLGA